MVKYGSLVEQFGGVPQDDGTKIREFIKKGIEFAKPTHTHTHEHDGVPCDHDHSQDHVHEETGDVTVFEVIKHNEGTGEICPKGAKVKVHYTGKFTNGKVFDSSHNRGQPLEFIVGQGQVIRGWDEGITQLKKGQKAKLVCPPDYAYGKNGAGGVIPPNATLYFEVELVDWKK